MTLRYPESIQVYSYERESAASLKIVMIPVGGTLVMLISPPNVTSVAVNDVLLFTRAVVHGGC